MMLPTPTASEALRFQALHKQQYGIDLPAREVLPLLTRLVQFYFLTGGHDARRQRLQQATAAQPTGDVGVPLIAHCQVGWPGARSAKRVLEAPEGRPGAGVRQWAAV